MWRISSRIRVHVWRVWFTRLVGCHESVVPVPCQLRTAPIKYSDIYHNFHLHTGTYWMAQWHRNHNNLSSCGWIGHKVVNRNEIGVRFSYSVEKGWSPAKWIILSIIDLGHKRTKAVMNYSNAQGYCECHNAEWLQTSVLFVLVATPLLPPNENRYNRNA